MAPSCGPLSFTYQGTAMIDRAGREEAAEGFGENAAEENGVLNNDMIYKLMMCVLHSTRHCHIGE